MKIRSEKQIAVAKQISLLTKQLSAIRREIYIHGDTRLNLTKLEHDLNEFTDRMFNYVDEEDISDILRL